MHDLNVVLKYIKEMHKITFVFLNKYHQLFFFFFLTVSFSLFLYYAHQVLITYAHVQPLKHLPKIQPSV